MRRASEIAAHGTARVLLFSLVVSATVRGRREERKKRSAALARP